MTVTELGMPQVYNISNSEVTTWLSCQRMYEFAFGMELAPKSLSTPLARGTLGHLFFQHYVEERLRLNAGAWNSIAHEQAYQFALTKTFMDAMNEGAMNLDTIMETQMLVQRYMAFHKGWPDWTLLGTEQRKDLQLTDTLGMPIRYDVYYIHNPSGQYTLGDYKFTYDFWSPHDHDINGQMPKYIATLKANGVRVDRGMLIEIRTRPLGAEKAADAKNLWKETPYYPSKARIRSMLKQHVAGALQIEEFRKQTPENRLNNAIPAFNKHGPCKYCNFADLCNALTEGKSDLSVDIHSGYTHNTYGYNGLPAGELI